MKNKIDLDNVMESIGRVKQISNERRSKPRNKNMPIPKKVENTEIKSIFGEKYEEELLKVLFKDELEKRKDDINESPYYEETSQKEHRKRTGEWDILNEEEIFYFDPELSYQITGYRPITMTQGLDFDPEPFIETRRVYERTKKYTEYRENTKLHRNFWEEQKRRCTEGYTVGKYRVTGDHYFFLNFYRMPITDGESKKGISVQEEGFPNFLAKQYEFFHYVELCEYLGLDVCMLKARGLGFSEILACLGVRPFITTRKFKTYYTASAEAQLSPVLGKCWNQLNWLNLYTNGGMKRSRQKIDNILHKRASVVDKEGQEYGRMSEIMGIVADHPRKVRGQRIHRLIYEEAGSNLHLVTSWIQGNALVELGGRKIGIKIAGGTGGDSGPQLAGLAKIFNDPITYGVLPYKNSHTRDGRIQYSGFFIPAHEFSLDVNYLDSRGVTNSDEFKKYYEKRRQRLQGMDLLDYCAEHCFTPDEALLKQGDNIFNSVLLSERITQIRVHKVLKNEPQPMILNWDNSLETPKINAIPVSESKLLVIEPPLLDSNGLPFKNLYVAGIDSIDMGTASSAIDNDVSDFCIVIKRRMHGMMPPKIVAIYKDRPRDIRHAYETALRLLIWYNCKALLEYTKISIQTWFKGKNAGHLFMSRPEFAISQQKGRVYRKKELIGVPSSEAVIKHGLELVAAYVEDYWDQIDFDEVLEQLLNYSYQDKKKFDIVAALQMVEIADEELSGITPTVINDMNKQWSDFGYYIDEYGIKRKGKIPKNPFENRIRWTTAQ